MSDYYNTVRSELIGIGPKRYGRCLDIGCGEGATGSYLLSTGRADEVVGVEYVEAAAKVASGQLSEVVVADLNNDGCGLLASLGRFDTVILGDVLEHLIDPGPLLSVVASEVLAPGGVVLISLPNVQSAEVILPLLMGEFRYRDSGILDRTHLRFYTKASATRMIRECGLVITKHDVTRPPVSSPLLRVALRSIGPYGVRRNLFACRLADDQVLGVHGRREADL